MIVKKIDKRRKEFKKSLREGIASPIPDPEKKLDLESLEMICNVQTFLDIEKSSGNLFYLYKHNKMTLQDCLIHQKFLDAHANLKSKVRLDWMIDSQNENNEIILNIKEKAQQKSTVERVRETLNRKEKPL